MWCGCRPDQPADKQVAVLDAPSKGEVSDKEAKEAEEAARQAANQAANQESLKKALEKLTEEELAQGEPLFQKAWAKFQEAIDMLPESEQNKPLKPQQVLFCWQQVHPALLCIPVPPRPSSRGSAASAGSQPQDCDFWF